MCLHELAFKQIKSNANSHYTCIVETMKHIALKNDTCDILINFSLSQS